MDVLALTILATLVGVETCVWWFFHPTLNALTREARVAGHARSARMLGRVMPFWYAAAGLSAGAAGLASAPGAGRWIWWAAAATLVLVSVVTIIALVPLNSAIASWEDGTAAQGWEATLESWDRRHGARTVVLAATLIAQGVALAWFT